ncbi:MAG: bifunctional 4-hydroxy-2-oxoglutarate aldolase/2-dehydro-3-deoxy-phosphogluconate aldolase [Cytophagales bacterium]|nr:bifunctional 4-hydroxy-2-oxoglutarate aldolase/2-dehydro-3-deoxy-phosphogluconate aldolase [Bernardetiaceae bacterium]MDW8204695.1 bifunctional 4-hydroxy-2-oxoglutarate aldolase/2-dehydro-3-deoxy-phosphogluconate aldolase [Cytophagales bacterium]
MNEFVKKLHQQKVLPLFTPEDVDFAKKIIEQCAIFELSIIELTLRHPKALHITEQLIHWANTENLPVMIGAGTVIDEQTATEAINAGVGFCVSPCIVPAVIHKVIEHHIPILPGCFTPTEMLQAYQMGASVLKIFPAQQFSPAIVKSVLAPLPFLPLMPSGGVTLEAANIGAWLHAGCIAVSMGSALIGEQALKNKQIAPIIANLQKLKDILHENFNH